MKGSSTGPTLGMLPIVTNSSPLRVTYPWQNFTPIVINVLVGCCVSPRISRDARIYGTLLRHPRLLKKKKNPCLLLTIYQQNI